ncbi:MAG TPA: hypothetical protein VIY27_07830 [Myxococcota bacterium]
MAGKTIKLDEETRPLMDEVMDLLHRRGVERLPLSVYEELAEQHGDGRVPRITQAVLIHLGLLCVRRHLTDADKARRTE